MRNREFAEIDPAMRGEKIREIEALRDSVTRIDPEAAIGNLQESARRCLHQGFSRVLERLHDERKLRVMVVTSDFTVDPEDPNADPLATADPFLSSVAERVLGLLRS